MDIAQEDLSNPLVVVELSDGVATLSLNRPEHANAMDLSTARALRTVVDEMGEREDVRVVALLGAGKRFCAGGDVTAMIAAEDRATFVEELAITLDDALISLARLAKPVVVGVHGAVAGAGLAVMLSCDVVIAAEGTKFATAYAGVGLTPDCGLSWLLPRAVGQQRALELLLTGGTLTAAEAREWGMVTHVVSPDDVRVRVDSLAQQWAKGPAHALGQARRLVRESWESDRSATGRDEARTIAAASVSPDAERRLLEFGQRR